MTIGIWKIDHRDTRTKPDFNFLNSNNPPIIPKMERRNRVVGIKGKKKPVSFSKGIMIRSYLMKNRIK
jgi:hypothetical protein